MATEFRLPEVGENIATGQVVRILVSVGDTIESGQSVLELETDKAVVEVDTSLGGTIKEIHVAEGEEIEVGQLILTVEEVSGDQARPDPEPEEEPSEKVAHKGPDEKEEVEEKPTLDTNGRDGKERISAPTEIAQAPAVERQPGTSRVPAPAAPSIRRLARELGVDINQIPGTGPGGRISTDDVKNYVRQLNLQSRPAVTGAPETPALPIPDFTKWGEIERESMTNIRRTTARRLGQAWATIPHVTHFDAADITELEALRKQYAKKAEAAGGKLTVTAIILKVVASALKVFPKFNASLDMANQEIIYKKYYHIGVAVDTEHGLLVPVIRDVDQKNILQLSVELTEVSEKARSRKVTLEELEGGSLTVTNLGGIGGTNFAPIINPPEVAILGVSRASTQPVFKDGGFEPRLIMPLSLSYDHRLIDGADAARFMRWIVQAIEQPFLLSLEG
jgi:pyruvate dehydrogenase E2 component (dihydrolipoamide acetyltransferase)